METLKIKEIFTVRLIPVRSPMVLMVRKFKKLKQRKKLVEKTSKEISTLNHKNNIPIQQMELRNRLSKEL